MGIQVVSYRCTLKNRMGRVISFTVAQEVLLHPDGAEDLPLKALSDAMKDLKRGESREIFLRAEDAYGFYDPKLVKTLRLDGMTIEKPFKVDEEVRVMKDGKSVLMKVIQVTSDTVTLDGNHPLAGQDLIFEIEAIDARDATPDEIGEPLSGPAIH